MADFGATGLSLPEDAIFDILSWTPVKSVCRFRRVSKEWQSLISDRAFVAKHKCRAVPERLLLETSYEDEEHPANAGLLVMDMKGKVVRAIKGLGVIPEVRSSIDHLICVFCVDGTIRVIDVVSGEELVAFPRSEEADAIRLGYAAASGSYKVVCLTTRVLQGQGGVLHQTCQVLTLGDGLGWRQAQSPPEQVSVRGFDCSGATVNGILYFLTSPPYEEVPKPQDRVLCFNLRARSGTRQSKAR
ncbi:hypothetical protein ACQ4PT_029093 [Festuca glaucescens]